MPFFTPVLPWLRRPPGSQEGAQDSASSSTSAATDTISWLAEYTDLPPATVALYSTYATVLATIVFLSWSINRKLSMRRSRSQAEPWLIAQSPTRVTRTRSNFVDLVSSPQDATPSQRAEYAELCAAMVQDAHDFVAADGGARKIVWERKPDVEGAAVYLARVAESPIVLIKGVLKLRVPSIEKLASYFAELDTTAKMAHSLTKLDPMFLDGRVIYRMAQKRWPVGGAVEDGTAPIVADDPHGKTQVEWACFAAPPLAPRDFCWLEHSTFAKAPEDGRQMFLSLCTSVEREEAPDLWATHGYVRAKLTSTGYIFKGTDEPDIWELSYVVQIDPKGIVPTWVVNLVAADQATNTARMRDAIAERIAAEEAMHADEDEEGWSLVPLQEALLRRDGSPTEIAIGRLNAGQTVQWRWMPGSEASVAHAAVISTMELEPSKDDADAAAAEAAGQPEASHELLERDDGSPIHMCSARAHATGLHCLKWTRSRSVLQMLTGTTPLITLFIQVRVL